MYLHHGTLQRVPGPLYLAVSGVVYMAAACVSICPRGGGGGWKQNIQVLGKAARWPSRSVHPILTVLSLGACQDLHVF
jgi:hypothetical protein